MLDIAEFSNIDIGMEDWAVGACLYALRCASQVAGACRPRPQLRHSGDCDLGRRIRKQGACPLPVESIESQVAEVIRQIHGLAQLLPSSQACAFVHYLRRH